MLKSTTTLKIKIQGCHCPWHEIIENKIVSANFAVQLQPNHVLPLFADIDSHIAEQEKTVAVDPTATCVAVHGLQRGQI